MEIATRRREQEVWQACDDLWSINGDMKSLTGDLIRERLVFLGKSRGSPNEIYRYRKTWMVSRRVKETSVHGEEGELDPISRAVRLVHEELKAEANAHISKLEEDFASELKRKEDLLADEKKALSKVMAEFSAIEQECAKAMARIKVQDEQLGSEIDLRKAYEKELLLNKSLLDKEKQACEVLVNQIKEIYQNEIQKTQCEKQELRTALETKITILVDEKRILGHEYSDKLNEIKTALYNQEIVNKHNEQKLRTALLEIKSLNDAALEKDQKMEQITHDNATMSSALVYERAELARVKAQNKSFETLLKKEGLLRKKSELMTARLRAMLFHKRGIGDDRTSRS